MTPIKKVITKNGKIQYHEYKLRQMRSFRISAADAELKLATGESYLVDKFWYEQEEETTAENTPAIEEVVTVEAITQTEQPATQAETKSNVLTFADKLKAKQDQTDMEKAKAHFVNNILPNMSMEEKQTILSNPQMIHEILLNVMIRTTVEKM